jgi:enolase-phosphatase E1
VSAVLLDIEGTTTSIAFVYETLFPYAAAQVESWLRERANEPATAAAIALILRDATAAEASLPPAAGALAVVRRHMAGDVKATGLKQLQGLLWEHGYRSGAIHGHVYADVPTCFATWRAAKRTIAIYSSGSVLAQKLIFGFSVAGDLTPHISAYFDTTTGPKREAASYTTIAAKLGLRPAEITFCTDQPGEAEAAAAAGLTAIVIMRPGNAPLPANLPFAVHGDLARV